MTLLFHLEHAADNVDNFTMAYAIYRECERQPNRLDPETIARILLAQAEFEKGKSGK